MGLQGRRQERRPNREDKATKEPGDANTFDPGDEDLELKLLL